MAENFSMLGIMNAALVAQGQDEILSGSDGLPEFRVLSRNWPTIVEAELEDGAYHFARKEAELRNRSPGSYGFPDAFMVPQEAIHVRRVWCPETRRELDWAQDGQHVHVSLPARSSFVRAEYLVVSEPHLWSANFARGVQMKLEAVILRALKEEHAESLNMEALADECFQRARTNSSKARTPQPAFRKGRIINASFGRG